MKTITQKTQASETRTKFTMILPPELDIKPRWSIEMPGNRTVNIYDATWTERQFLSGGSAAEMIVTGFKTAIIKTSDGMIVENSRYAEYGNYRTLLDVRLHLDRLAVLLTPKKRTVIAETEED